MTKIVDTATEGLLNPPLPSAFRMWVNNNWVQNTEERLIYGEKPYSMKEYWSNFKWWLKLRYRNLTKNKSKY
jgi:hypothetical protein